MRPLDGLAVQVLEQGRVGAFIADDNVAADAGAIVLLPPRAVVKKADKCVCGCGKRTNKRNLDSEPDHRVKRSLTGIAAFSATRKRYENEDLPLGCVSSEAGQGEETKFYTILMDEFLNACYKTRMGVEVVVGKGVSHKWLAQVFQLITSMGFDQFVDRWGKELTWRVFEHLAMKYAFSEAESNQVKFRSEHFAKSKRLFGVQRYMLAESSLLNILFQD